MDYKLGTYSKFSQKLKDMNQNQLDILEGASSIQQNNLKKSNKKDFFGLLHQLTVEVTSIIGFSYPFDESRKLLNRLLWVLLLLFGTALAAYQIQYMIVYFVSRPTNTAYDYQHNDELFLPQITICNENAMERSTAAKRGIADVLSMMYPQFDLGPKDPVDLSSLRSLNYTQQQWEDLRYELAQPVTDLFKFNFSIGNTQLTIANTSRIETDMGICVTLNAGGTSLSVTESGAQNGLTMILFINQSNYLVTNSYGAGFRIMVHDPTEPPQLKKFGFLLSPGSMAFVSLQLQKISDLGPPYGDCNPDPDYHQTWCELNCTAYYANMFCKCKPHYLPGPYRKCTILEDYECIDRIPKELKPSCSCARQCNSNLYPYSISHSQMSEAFKTYIFNHRCTGCLANKDVIQLDYSSITIYFSTLQNSELVTSAAYEVMALFSDVGGALGLVLGATLLSLFELIEMMLGLISYFRNR